MKYLWKLERGNYVTKNTILTKRIMLGVLGWRYLGRSYLPFKCGIPKKERHSCIVAFNENNERVNIGKTMQEAEAFCLKKYKEFYFEINSDK